MKLVNLCSNISNRIYSKLCMNLYEKLDKCVSRHIVVIESDDWGSIRVPSKEVYEALKSEGYAMDTRPYERYDCLECNEDVEALINVLMKYRDFKGHPPVITLNYLSANPDFLQIEKDKYQKYSLIRLEDTYKRTVQSANVLSLIKQGISFGVFRPQCHGREHFNILEWLDALRGGDRDLLTAFRYGMCGIFPQIKPSLGNKYMVALRSVSDESQQYVCDAVCQSLEMFEETWGFQAKTFIAPCYTWSDKIEKELCKNGVELLQGGRVRRSSDNRSDKYMFVGQKSNGLIYSVRNCFFEPATDSSYSTKALMSEIEHVFRNKHIVVISSHRINYVSGINKNNRDKNLKFLDEFLSTLLMKYPDVEFMSSDQLIEILK